MIEQVRGWARRVRIFLVRDLWRPEMLQVKGPMGYALRLLHIIVLSWRGYKRDKLPLHASALTFTTLMSLVPALAITFALMKGMSQETEVLAKINTWLEPMPEDFQAFVSQNIIQQVMNLNFAALGGLGVGILLFTLIRLLGAIEASFNTVWGVGRPRSFTRKVTDYVSTVIVVPLLFLVAGAFQSKWIISHLGVAAPLYFKMLKFSGLFTAWLAFAFLLKFMPNTVVKLRSAAIGGLVGAISFLIWQKLYIALQVGVVSKNTIFGAFATVPIFLAWLYVSWVIILVAAEISFAVQSKADVLGEQIVGNTSFRARVRVALELLLEAGKNMRDHGRPLDLVTCSEESRTPLRVLMRVTGDLCESGWMTPARAEKEDEEDLYVLAWTPDRIRVRDVIQSLWRQGVSADELGDRSGTHTAESLLQTFEDGAGGALSNQTLADILNAPPTDVEKHAD